MGIDPVRAFLGVMWLILGIGILVRRKRDEADSRLAATLSGKSEPKIANQQLLETASGLCCLLLGLLHFLLPFLYPDWYFR